MPIIPGGDAAYFSQLPIKAMVEAMQAEGIPAAVSNSAGTFVCNHILYQSLYQTHTRYPEIKAGFMHIPFLPEQAIHRPSTPSMSLDDTVRGIKAALKAIIAFDGKEDVKTIGGKTH